METAIHTWEVYPQLSKDAFHAAEMLGISALQAQLLANRGISTPEQMRIFLNADYASLHDPLTLIEMPQAVERIRYALDHDEHITVYGDFDADGVTSSALLYRALRTLKPPDAPLDYHIPNRQRDGCGLNEGALHMLHARGTRLIVTTDCASSDVAQVELARTLGIDVIITDHHHPPTPLPHAYAMVNPWRPDCAYGERVLCGAGIAFKLVQALYRAYGRTPAEEMELLDLVAIGTIADIAPLTGENHILTRLGLQQLNTTRKPGLLALIRSANLQSGRIRERDIAYSLSPRINAAGRMEEASIAFDLLTTDDEQRAIEIVTYLEMLNVKRQQQTEEMMQNVREQARSQSEKRVVLVMGNDWNEGIIGLVAGKLSEELDKPVLVLSNDRTKQLSRGSARSHKGFNLIAALRAFADQLERYGGHTQAAGFTIKSDRITDLHHHLLLWQDEQARTVIETLPNGTTSAPSSLAPVRLPIEGEQNELTGFVTEQEALPPPIALTPKIVDLLFTRWNSITYDLYKQIRQLAPFGAGNPEPVFKLNGLRLYHIRSGGRDGQNLQLWLGMSDTPNGNAMRRQGTFFKAAARLKEFEGVTQVNIVFRLESPEDESKQEVWFRLLALEAVGA